MATFITVAMYLIGFAIVLFMVVVFLVDWAARIDYLRKNFPWLIKRAERKKWHGTLLLVCVCLLIGVGYELWNEKDRLRAHPPSANTAEDLGAELGRLFPSQRARMSFDNIHFVRGTMNIGKVPFKAADTPWQKVQPDGTVVVTLPLGFQWQPITVEAKVKNIGELYALDIHWFGGVVLSEKLDAAGEDALFDRMKTTPITVQPDIKPQETVTLVVKGNTEPPLKDVNDVVQQKKFPYLVLVGKFRDKLGPTPDVEFCGHYGDDDPLFALDHSCVRHNN